MSLTPKKPAKSRLYDATYPVTVRLYSGADDPLEPMDRPDLTVANPADVAAGLAAFEAVVERISYRPGYILRVTRRAPVLLRVVAELDDSYHPGQRLEVAMHFPVPDWLLEFWGSIADTRPDHAQDEMVRWVRRALGWHELHERDEWLRVDGVRPFDPHAGDPDSTRLGVRP